MAKSQSPPSVASPDRASLPNRGSTRVMAGCNVDVMIDSFNVNCFARQPLSTFAKAIGG